MAELVEIDSARENRLVGLLLRTSAANQQMRPDNATAASETAFWTGGIVREAAQILVCIGHLVLQYKRIVPTDF